jgi:hypothetical protein
LPDSAVFERDKREMRTVIVVFVLAFPLIALAVLEPYLARAQRGEISNAPFLLTENFRNDPTPLNNSGNYDLRGHTCRTDAGGLPCVPTINPAVKTLVLITAGASNGASVGPSAFVPTNLRVIDNLNIYDGALYADLDPLLGQTQSSLGTGSIGPRLADLLITNGSFARVILVPIAIGGATSAMYAPGGVLYDHSCVAMRRLASHGITPATSGVTFAAIWHMGENDSGVPQATYQANVSAQTTHLNACGFSGRQFVNKETILANTANGTIQAAQAALIDNVTYFVGGNMDSLTGRTDRQADGTHLTAAGQASQATLEYNAMHASGAPF